MFLKYALIRQCITFSSPLRSAASRASASECRLCTASSGSRLRLNLPAQPHSKKYLNCCRISSIFFIAIGFKYHCAQKALTSRPVKDASVRWIGVSPSSTGGFSRKSKMCR